ncbi:MAG TPA: hypothetical protein VMY42_24995 [Thermoguttaceae bacterium]|nr:hypothetical protein [Thermoguttaceae bacterium]
MKTILILMALALLASAAQASLLTDVVGSLIEKHGSVAYARSFGEPDKEGGIATLDVGIGRIGLGSQAELRISGDFVAAYTREDIGTKTDEDLVFGLGVGGKLVPKSNPDFAIKAGVGWVPGFHGCWYLGASVKF